MPAHLQQIIAIATKIKVMNPKSINISNIVHPSCIESSEIVGYL